MLFGQEGSTVDPLQLSLAAKVPLKTRGTVTDVGSEGRECQAEGLRLFS